MESEGPYCSSCDRVGQSRLAAQQSVLICYNHIVPQFETMIPLIRQTIPPSLPRFATCTPVTHCRICGQEDLLPICNLGMQPLANRLLLAPQRAETEPHFPLRLIRCAGCGLVQLQDIVPPSELFEHYEYIPSVSRDYMEHFSMFANECIEKMHLDTDSLVIDIGSNDGSLLSMFAQHTIPVLGIDPAKNLTSLSEKKNVPVLSGYFSEEMAITLHENKLSPDLILAFNTFGHIPDLIDFCNGIRTLLHPQGSFIAQFPYLDDMLRYAEFDTIYHEHCSYFSLRPLLELCKRTGLELFDVERIPIHGGSLRIQVGHPGAHVVSPHVAALLDQEKENEFEERRAFVSFQSQMQKRISDLQSLVQSLKKSGKTIAGFGMPAKGTILLNACGFDTDTIDYIVDGTPQKQGKFSPGSHIPIFAEEHLYSNPPDFLLVLAWNFFEEIERKHTQFVHAGGKFILPMPAVTIV